MAISSENTYKCSYCGMPYAIHNTLPSICDSDSADCAVCVLARQAAVADNVSRQNGREPALDVLRAQPSHTGKRF